MLTEVNTPKIITSKMEDIDQKQEQITEEDTKPDDAVDANDSRKDAEEQPQDDEDLEEGEIESDEEEEAGADVQAQEEPEEVVDVDKENDRKSHRSGSSRDKDRKDRDRDSRNKDKLKRELESDEEKKRLLKEKLRMLEQQMASDDDLEDDGEEEDYDEMGVYASGGSPSRSGRKRRTMSNSSTSETNDHDRSASPTSSSKRRRRDRDRDRSDRHRDRDRKDRDRDRNTNTKEKTEICKMFMLGKCPKSPERCPYSHDADPPKIMELCKFYLLERCAKREKCLYLHKGFPCKYFHTGHRCMDTAESCKFSHEPLTDVTRPILLKHLEAAPKEILGDFPRMSREAAEALVYQTEAKNKGWGPQDPPGGPGGGASGPDGKNKGPRKSRWGQPPPGLPPQPPFGNGNGPPSGPPPFNNGPTPLMGGPSGPPPHHPGGPGGPGMGPPGGFGPPGPGGPGPMRDHGPPPGINPGPGLLGPAPNTMIPPPGVVVPGPIAEGGPHGGPPPGVGPNGGPGGPMGMNRGGGDQNYNEASVSSFLHQQRNNFNQDGPFGQRDHPMGGPNNYGGPGPNNMDQRFHQGQQQQPYNNSGPFGQQNPNNMMEPPPRNTTPTPDVNLDFGGQDDGGGDWNHPDRDHQGFGGGRPQQQHHGGGGEMGSPTKKDPRMRDPRSRDPRGGPPSNNRGPSEQEKEKRMLEVDLSMFGDLELPSMNDKSDETEEDDVDNNEMGLPFKPHNMNSIAKEIDGSIFSHSPLDYLLRRIVITKPDYSELVSKQNLSMSKIQLDPRLRRYSNKKDNSSKKETSPTPKAASMASPKRKASAIVDVDDNVYNPTKELYGRSSGGGGEVKEVYSPSQDVQDLYKTPDALLQRPPSAGPPLNLYNPRQDLEQHDPNPGWGGGGPSYAPPPPQSSFGSSPNDNSGSASSRDPRARRDPRRRD